MKSSINKITWIVTDRDLVRESFMNDLLTYLVHSEFYIGWMYSSCWQNRVNEHLVFLVVKDRVIIWVDLPGSSGRRRKRKERSRLIPTRWKTDVPSFDKWADPDVSVVHILPFVTQDASRLYTIHTSLYSDFSVRLWLRITCTLETIRSIYI